VTPRNVAAARVDIGVRALCDWKVHLAAAAARPDASSEHGARGRSLESAHRGISGSLRLHLSNTLQARRKSHRSIWSMTASAALAVSGHGQLDVGSPASQS